MIRSRWINDCALAVEIKPPFGELAKAATALLISAASLMLIGVTSTRTDDAADWITANWPMPAVRLGAQSTAARVTNGATSFSNSSHFAHKLYSNIIKPVALPPGRDRLLTKPEPTGSGTIANTDGTVPVAWINAPAPRLPKVRMTSGARAANSAAYLRVSA